jgi:hypothetical protein
VALQHTTREVWATKGGFIPYEIENQLMRPALRWAIYLLILGFPAASRTSANCFGSFPMLHVAFPRFGRAFSRFGLAFPRFGRAFSRFGLAFSRFGLAFSRFGLAFSRFGLAFPRFGRFSAFKPYCGFGYSRTMAAFNWNKREACRTF